MKLCPYKNCNNMKCKYDHIYRPFVVTFDRRTTSSDMDISPPRISLKDFSKEEMKALKEAHEMTKQKDKQNYDTYIEHRNREFLQKQEKKEMDMKDWNRRLEEQKMRNMGEEDMDISPLTPVKNPKKRRGKARELKSPKQSPKKSPKQSPKSPKRSPKQSPKSPKRK